MTHEELKTKQKITDEVLVILSFNNNLLFCFELSIFCLIDTYGAFS